MTRHWKWTPGRGWSRTGFYRADSPITYYLAGPMSKYKDKDWNYPAFYEAAAWLRRSRGMIVVNPAENFGGDTTLPYEVYIRQGVEQVKDADAVIVLPGWQNSRGALLEVWQAQAQGKPVFNYKLIRAGYDLMTAQLWDRVRVRFNPSEYHYEVTHMPSWVSEGHPARKAYRETEYQAQRESEMSVPDVANVKDYVAVGDGITDDAEAIQAALDRWNLPDRETRGERPAHCTNGTPRRPARKPRVVPDDRETGGERPAFADVPPETYYSTVPHAGIQLDLMPAETVLEEAGRLVEGDRSGQYGTPEENFRDIAAFWSTYLGLDITSFDVAQMMVLMKVARGVFGLKRDNLVDAAGYLRCAERVQGDYKPRKAALRAQSTG